MQVGHSIVMNTPHTNQDMTEVARNMKINPNQRGIIRDSHFLSITMYGHAALRPAFLCSWLGIGLFTMVCLSRDTDLHPTC